MEGKTAALKGSFFPTPPTADLKDLHDYQYTNPLWAPDIKTWEVEEAIRMTSPDKAPGEDQLPSRVLHEAIQELKEPLTRLFN